MPATDDFSATTAGHGPIAGHRVLDLSGDLGAYGARLLADLGADVLKVEPLGGDRQRLRPPFAEGRPGPDASLTFAYYNANKRGARVDFDADDVTGTLAALAEGADVIMIAPSARTPVPGWDPNTKCLAWAPPAALVCCLSAGGQDGPWRDRPATHLTAFAAGGLMASVGPEAGPPRALPGQAAYDEFSAHAAATVLLALLEGGPGRLVEMSLHDLLAYRHGVEIAFAAAVGRDYTTRAARPDPPPAGVLDLADGQVELGVFHPPQWAGFVELLGRPAELGAPELADRQVRLERADELRPVIARLVGGFRVDDFVEAAQAHRLPCAPQNTPDRLAEDPQLASRDFWVKWPEPAGGMFTGPGPVLRSAPRLVSPDRFAAPSLTAPNDGWRERPGPPAPPGIRLEDVKVLSFGTAIAGNVTATMLAELGADVVKIESPARPDPVRNGPLAVDLPRVFEPSGAETNLRFGAYARSVRAVGLDLKVASDVGRFRELVRRADVLIDNFGPGVLAGWGLSHESLAALNPRLVMVSVSGYGRTGPRSGHRAYGTTINAYVGLSRIWYPHATQSDWTAVAHALPALFAALHRRARTGEGAIIDISQVEAAIAMLPSLYLEALNTPGHGPAEPPAPNSVPGSAATAVVPCGGHDSWLAVECEDSGDLESVRRLLASTSAADPMSTVDPMSTADMADMADAAGPTGETSGFHAALAAWAARRTAARAAEELVRAGVAAAEVVPPSALLGDPRLWARGALTQVIHPDIGAAWYPAPFHRLSGRAVGVRRPAPRLGEHDVEVRRDWLGK
ncbi:CoA transferase [Streptosporangium sp. NPDC051022]|uniref:CaiB/BaiF CoA-transferase family protein n=1 Tax=Streptosporangium sp. NPDC051022 TaxID=3155752 RepID=UPI0034494E5D